MSSESNVGENISASAPKSGAESRRTPRRVYHRAIGVLKAGQYEVMQGLQISEGGMLFRSEHSLAIKAHVVISLVLPGGEVVVTRGEVIYEMPDAGKTRQIGIRFRSLPLHLRRVIRNYVTAKTQAEAEEEAARERGSSSSSSAA